jgi:hypothetical protein
MASGGDGGTAHATRTFVLRHPGHCTGMFWRRNPKPTAAASEDQVGGGDWPRNGSVLKGIVHSKLADGMDWLEVSAWTQAGSKKEVTGCGGLWMPFEQGGLLLHETKA